jgi:hypothetical protein
MVEIVMKLDDFLVQLVKYCIRILISNTIIDDLEGLEKISMKKLEAVFSKGETEALFASAKNESPIRQYLYRARRKYALFEEIFEMRLEF